MSEVPNPVGVLGSAEAGQGNTALIPGQPGDISCPAVEELPDGVPAYLKNTRKRKGVPAEPKKRKTKRKAPASEQAVVDVTPPASNPELRTSVIDVDAPVDVAPGGVISPDPQDEALISDFRHDSQHVYSPARHSDGIPPPSSSAGGNVPLLTSPGLVSIWESGSIPGEVRRLIDPPPHFNDFTPLEDAEIAYLRRIEVDSILASSVVNKYSQLKLDASRLAADLSSSRSAQRKAEEDLRVSAEACAKATADFTEASSSLVQANATLEQARIDLQTTQGDLKTSRDALEASQADLLKARGDLVTLQADLVKVQGDLNLSVGNLSSLRNDYDLLVKEKSVVDERLKQSLARVEELVADMTTSVKDAFGNCLSQIHFLNPSVTLNLTGVHHNAYVHNNQLVLAEPEASMSTFADEGGDEGEEDEEEESRR